MEAIEARAQLFQTSSRGYCALTAIEGVYVVVQDLRMEADSLRLARETTSRRTSQSRDLQHVPVFSCVWAASQAVRLLSTSVKGERVVVYRRLSALSLYLK